MDVDHQDLVLDGHRGRSLRLLHQGRAAGAEQARVMSRCGTFELGGRVWEDDGAAALGVHDVLDADRDSRADDLLHRERVDDLGSVEGQFCGLRGRDGREKSSRGYFARVRREYTVDFLPDLKFLCAGADRDQGRTQICVTTTDLVEQTPRNSAKVACYHRYSMPTSLDLLPQDRGQGVIKVLIEALAANGEVDHLGEIHILRVDATIL